MTEVLTIQLNECKQAPTAAILLGWLLPLELGIALKPTQVSHNTPSPSVCSSPHSLKDTLRYQ